MNTRHTSLLMLCILLVTPLFGTIFGAVRGIVHDPDHRPVPDANVSLQSASSGFKKTGKTDSNGEFEFSAVPIGEYRVSVMRDGFAPVEQSVVVTSGSAPVLHFQFRLATATESVEVTEHPQTVSPDASTPATLVSRHDVDRIPGADQTNSLRMITSFVPGAYVIHDLLHIRGGHQVSWLIDGVPVPNTSIASNAGVQFDPKDIDYLEVQRGSYSAEYGDRTYGVFNIVPRSGFERNNEAQITATYGGFHQTNDHFTFGSHTERFAYYVGVNGNRSDLGLQTPTSVVIHDRADGFGAFTSLIYNRSPNDQFRLVAAARRDDYQIPNSPDNQTDGVRDLDRERDALINFSWVYVPKAGLLLTVSPFYHFNRANYIGGPHDPGLSTLDKLDTQYGGAQVTLNSVSRRHNARVGVYAYGEHDSRSFGLTATDGSGLALRQQESPSGGLVAVFLEDQFKISQPDELFLLDHDQQHTLSLGGNANLPRRAWIAANLYYGSGFPDNGGPARLPEHTTFDLSLGKSFGESWSVAVQALNVANRRFLLDNSPTFGGTHYFDPRQIYGEIRYRFHY